MLQIPPQPLSDEAPAGCTVRRESLHHLPLKPVLSHGVGRDEEELGGLVSLCPSLSVAAQHLLTAQQTRDQEIKS